MLGKRAVGACHFGSFYEAMNAAQHLVKLKPIAVELVDRTMLELAGEIAMFRPTLKAFVHGEPEAILLVEFDEGEFENMRRIKELDATMGDLGFSFDKSGAKWGGVVEVYDASAAGRDRRRAHLRPQHHDVDEGGGKAGLLRRGLRGAADVPRGLHLAAHRVFENTARAAPGTRTPRSAACMCARCSTCGRRRT